MKVLFMFISKQPLIKININCTHFLSTYFYSSFCSSFALCFLFLSFAFSFDIFSRKPSSFWHLYKLIYLLTQTSFVLRSTNRNLSLSAGQKQHTDGPVVFTALFFILFSLATTFFSLAIDWGPYKFAYSSLHLTECFKCLMVLSSV